MKINSNTSVEEVKQKTKTTMVGICSVNKSEPKIISEGIRKQFDAIRQTNEEIDLDDSTITKLLKVQNIVYTNRNNNMSIEELLKFIRNAMNYSQFQIWLLDNQIKGVNVTLNEKINKFLTETSADEILKLYDIEQNYNQNNIESIRKTSEELFDTYRTGRLATSRKTFSEYDFIRLFLSTLLKKGTIKFDSVNLGYRLIDFYRNNEYLDLFDMPVVNQIEGDYLDMSSCLANAHLGGLISSPIQGTHDRLIIIPDTDEIIKGYSEEYKTKMDKLVNDYLLQQEKMITPSGLVIDDIDDITKDCRTCQNMSCRVEQNEKPVAGCFGYINNNQDNEEKVKRLSFKKYN